MLFDQPAWLKRRRKKNQVEFLNGLLETAKTERININLLVHISRFLLDHVPETVKFIGPTQLQNLLGIETNMVAERQNQKRRLMHWYLTNLVVSFADIEKLEYSLLGKYGLFSADKRPNMFYKVIWTKSLRRTFCVHRHRSCAPSSSSG